MNNIRFVFPACLVALLVFIVGCGGGGGSSTNDGQNSGGNVTLAYEIRGVAGELVEAVAKSDTPQSVKLRVRGEVRTIPNVIVPTSFEAGQELPIVLQGSKLINAAVNDPAQGASIGSTGVKVPISATGELLASVLGGIYGVAITLPPSTWQGFSLPNGYSSTFYGTDEGDYHIRVNGPIQYPGSVATKTGTLSMQYDSPVACRFQVEFTAAGGEGIQVLGTALPAKNGTVAADWSVIRLSSTRPAFTSAGASSF